jgi:hypothetical protein
MTALPLPADPLDARAIACQREHDGPWFHFNDLSEADVQALARREVPEWIVTRAAQLIDYELSDLQANARKR